MVSPLCMVTPSFPFTGMFPRGWKGPFRSPGPHQAAQCKTKFPLWLQGFRPGRLWLAGPGGAAVIGSTHSGHVAWRVVSKTQVPPVRPGVLQRSGSAGAPAAAREHRFATSPPERRNMKSGKMQKPRLNKLWRVINADEGWEPGGGARGWRLPWGWGAVRRRGCDREVSRTVLTNAPEGPPAQDPGARPARTTCADNPQGNRRGPPSPPRAPYMLSERNGKEVASKTLNLKNC